MGATNFSRVDADELNGPLGTTTPAAGAFTNFGFNGWFTPTPQLVTAAGATQGNATAITKSHVIVTVALTASTKGVILPTAVTGRVVRIANAATFGVKVYPAVGARIAAVATNGADT